MHKLEAEVVILSLKKASMREEEMQLHCSILSASFDSTKATYACQLQPCQLKT